MSSLSLSLSNSPYPCMHPFILLLIHPSISLSIYLFLSCSPAGPVAPTTPGLPTPGAPLVAEKESVVNAEQEKCSTV